MAAKYDANPQYGIPCHLHFAVIHQYNRIEYSSLPERSARRMPQDVGIARYCERFHATVDQLTGYEHQDLSVLQTIPASATVETPNEKSRKISCFYSSEQARRRSWPVKISMRAKSSPSGRPLRRAAVETYLPDARASCRVRVRKAFGAAPWTWVPSNSSSARPAAC